MNFTFADVSNVFMDMVQSDLSKNGLLNGKTSEPGKQIFAEKLSKTMEKNQDSTPHDASAKFVSEKSGSDQTDSQPVNASQVGIRQAGSAHENFIGDSSGVQNLPSDKGIQTILEKLSQKKGLGFAIELKNIFLELSQGDLKNLSIDASGLEALKKMLLKAGFKQSDLDKLIAELSSDAETESVSLDKFFEKLFNGISESELSADENKQTELTDEIFMLPSVIPFLQSILSSMGISQEKIQEMLSLADKGEKGISLDTIIENLKSIQKAAFYSYDHYQTKGNDKNITQILNQLGLDTKGSNSSGFNLDDLIRSFESVRNKAKDSVATTSLQDAEQKNMTDEKHLDLLTALFKGMKTTQEKAAEISPFEFSADRIKDEFKNTVVGINADKSSLKSQADVSSSLNQTAKQMASLMEGKENTPSDKVARPQLKEVESVLKQYQSRGIKSADSSQVSASNSKISQDIQNLNSLKTEAPMKNLPNYVTHQLTKGLVRAINQGENTLRLQLNPPELGRLMMTIDKSGDTIRVSIVTESLATKEILTSNAADLKTALSNSGVNLEKFDVDMNSNFRQSMADAKNQTDDFSRKRQNREKMLSDLNSIDGINDAGSIINTLNLESSLHFVA